jgi:hypothetical protein
VSIRSCIGRSGLALATLVVAGATSALGVVATSAMTPAAALAAPRACVAVIVDFRQLGGAVQTRCAQGDPATGLQALAKAGFTATPRPRDGLICEIDARPSCADTTSTTYWSYWYRAPGSSRWVYASEGAGTHNPKPGSTEAWVWQDGGRQPPPSIRADVICPQLAAASSTPTPTHTKSKQPKASTRPTTQPPPDTTRSTARPTPTKTTTAPAQSATNAPSSSSSSSSAAAPATDSTGGSATDAAPAAKSDDGGELRGATGVALGGIVILGIGAATVLRARRGRAS